MTSLLKEFVNQADLRRSDGSDAGKTDVQNKAPAADVKFSLMRNTINSDGKVTGSDVANYLEKATDINDEVDTVLYGLETSDGEVVKVYVNASEADAFEAEMKKMLGMEDDVEEAINELATKFDIVDVIWPKGTGPDAQGDGPNETDSEGGELDLDQSAELGDPANDGSEVDADAEGDDQTEDPELVDAEVIGDVRDKKRVAGDEEEGDDTTASADDEDEEPELDADGNPVKKKKKAAAAASSDDEEDPDADPDAAASDEEDEEGGDTNPDGSPKKKKKPAKKDDKSEGGDKGSKLSAVAAKMKTEAKLQAGWYVYNGDKTVAGPMEEEDAKTACKAKGGSSKGFTTGYISDTDAKTANETQGDSNMTLGSKFLQRVLAESKTPIAEAGEDRDGVMDGFDIQLDSQQRALANKLKWKLPKQIIALFALIGIPGVKLNSSGAEASIQEAAEMLRSQMTIRRAFMDFYKAYATAKGKMIEKDKPAAEPVTEARLKRGNYLQKQLETVLVKLGLPEDLVSTTGPGVVGSALFRASKDIEDNGELKEKLRMLAVRMGIKPSDANAPLKDDEEELGEAQGMAYELTGNALDPKAARQVVAALKSKFGGASLVSNDGKVTRIRVFAKNGESSVLVKSEANAVDGAGKWATKAMDVKVAEALELDEDAEEKCYTVMTRRPGKSNMETHDYDGVSKAAVKAMLAKKGLEVVSIELKKSKVEEAIDPSGADIYADAVMGFVAALGLPDTAFNRQARTILGKEFRDMRQQVNVGPLVSLVKRMTAQFTAAKDRVTRQTAAQPTTTATTTQPTR